MEEFGDAVDGYVDVEDQLTRYLLARAADRFQEERAEKEAISSVDDFEARRRRVRETFIDSLGGLDDRPDDPVASLAGRDPLEVLGEQFVLDAGRLLDGVLQEVVVGVRVRNVLVGERADRRSVV